MTKINQKFFYYNLEDLIQDLIKNSNTSAIINKQSQKIINCLGDNRVLIIAHVWESYNPYLWKKNVEQLIIQLKTHIPDLRIIQLANTWYFNLDAKLKLVDSVHYIDFFLFLIYHKIFVDKVSTPAKKWNSEAKKILFLTGKPSRFNRVRLLYKLIKEGLLAHVTWSFSCRNLEELETSASYVPEMTKLEFGKFVKLYTNFPDKYFPTKSWRVPNLYKNKLFNLISESDFDRAWAGPWITEKTWLAIANRLPFILAGEHKTLDRLSEMGFKTFQNFLLISNYDNPDRKNYLHDQAHDFFQNKVEKKIWENFYQEFKGPDWPDQLEFSKINTLPYAWQCEIQQSYKPAIQADNELRIDAIVQNVNFWIHNISKYQKQIEIDVETNYNKFVELGQKNSQLLADIENQYCLENGCLKNFILQPKTIK